MPFKLHLEKKKTDTNFPCTHALISLHAHAGEVSWLGPHNEYLAAGSDTGALHVRVFDDRYAFGDVC